MYMQQPYLPVAKLKNQLNGPVANWMTAKCQQLVATESALQFEQLTFMFLRKIAAAV
jgi:hypothetical protein